MGNTAVDVEVEDTRRVRQDTTGTNLADVADVDIVRECKLTFIEIGRPQPEVSTGEVAGIKRHLEMRNEIHMFVDIKPRSPNRATVDEHGFVEALRLAAQGLGVGMRSPGRQ